MYVYFRRQRFIGSRISSDREKKLIKKKKNSKTNILWNLLDLRKERKNEKLLSVNYIGVRCWTGPARERIMNLLLKKWAFLLLREVTYAIKISFWQWNWRSDFLLLYNVQSTLKICYTVRRYYIIFRNIRIWLILRRSNNEKIIRKTRMNFYRW